MNRSYSQICFLADASDRTEPGTSPFRESHNSALVPSVLVVCSDFHMRGRIGETLLLTGVTPTLAPTLREASGHLATLSPDLIVCQDRLSDGRYTDMLLLTQFAGLESPLIVVSSTGDWPDYLSALDLGVYDFLAFPLIPGELQRIVTNHLKKTFALRVPFNAQS